MNDFILGKVTQRGLALFCLLLLLLFVGGCGSSEDNPSIDTKPGPDVDFSGDWNMHEELEGCGSTETLERDYPIVIKQDGNSATLEVTKQNYIDCTISDDQLQCGGDLSLVNGGRIDFSTYNLWYKGDDLAGEGSWTFYDTDNKSCTGTSTFSATSGAAPNPDITDFNGEWDIYEEQEEGAFRYTQYRYTVRIEQTGTQATLSKGNEQMTCNVVAENLVCNGAFSFPIANGTYTYDSYTLRYDSNNGLTGEADWTYTDQGNDFPGRSNLTTTRPEVGSIFISNNMDFPFRLVNISPCDSDSWGINQISDPLEIGYGHPFRDLQPGCYDIRVCEDVDAERCEQRPRNHVNVGETLSLAFDSSSSLRLDQIKLNTIQHLDR
jgi:hypothetical protein